MSNVGKKDIYDPEKFNKPFPTLLRELANKLKDEQSFSQEKLAKELEISRQTLIDYQKGSTKPDIDTAKRIVEKFNDLCNLNYTIDFWMGTEEISKGIKKAELPISNESLEMLKEYKRGDAEIIALNILLKQRKFLKELSRYIIYGNLNEAINQNETTRLFVDIEGIPLPNVAHKKYCLYDVQEQLPLLKEFASTIIKEEVNLNEESLFNYLYYMLEVDFDIEIEGHKEYEFEEIEIEQHRYEEYEKYLEECAKKPEIKRLEAGFEKFVKEKDKEDEEDEIEKEVKNNVCSRNRKGKKV